MKVYAMTEFVGRSSSRTATTDHPRLLSKMPLRLRKENTMNEADRLVALWQGVPDKGERLRDLGAVTWGEYVKELRVAMGRRGKPITPERLPYVGKIDMSGSTIRKWESATFVNSSPHRQLRKAIEGLAQRHGIGPWEG